MQPWGAIWDLEADASCKEEKEEEVWLKKQVSPGSSVSGLHHWLQQQQAKEAARGVGGAQGGQGGVCNSR